MSDDAENTDTGSSETSDVDATRVDADASELLPPGGVSASTSRANDIEVRWTSVPGAVAYRVERCPEDCDEESQWSTLSEQPFSSTAALDAAVAVPGLPQATETLDV